MDSVIYHLSNMPLAGSLGYLLLVNGLNKVMSSRETAVAVPKPVLVAYNAAQVAINAYVAYAIAVATGGRVWGLGLSDTPALRYAVWLHYLCKVRAYFACQEQAEPLLRSWPLLWNTADSRLRVQYLDMVDTLIIVLRKKSEQLSFLHLWHHSTIVVVWGWVVGTWPADSGSSVYGYGAWINACVHVVMCAPSPSSPCSLPCSASELTLPQHPAHAEQKPTSIPPAMQVLLLWRVCNGCQDPNAPQEDGK